MKFPHCFERFHRGENGFLRGDYVASWVYGLSFLWMVVGFLGQNGPAGPEPCRSFLQNRPDFLVLGRGGGCSAMRADPVSDDDGVLRMRRVVPGQKEVSGKSGLTMRNQPLIM